MSIEILKIFRGFVKFHADFQTVFAEKRFFRKNRFIPVRFRKFRLSRMTELFGKFRQTTVQFPIDL